MPSYNVLFALSVGLKSTMKVPVGTCNNIREHVETITEECGLEVEQYMNNPPHWRRSEPAESVDDEKAGDLVRLHNNWVKWLHRQMIEWSKNPPEEYEKMTSEFAATIWHGLSKLDLPEQRWSAEYYREEMQCLFDVMRGENDDEINWETDTLTSRQAVDVINLFSVYLDHHDIRLELPEGGDQLYSSDEYEWCPKHMAIPIDDVKEDEDGHMFCPECEESLE